jgi:hypothetical protein
MARATGDRISGALRLLAALEREERRRNAARRRRRAGWLFAITLTALGAIAAAPNELAGSAFGAANALAGDLQAFIGASHGDDASADVSAPRIAGPTRREPAGLRIIVSHGQSTRTETATQLAERSSRLASSKALRE